MKNYYRVMLGRKSVHAEICFANGFIGADFGFDQDLSDDLPERLQAFNHKFRAVWLEKHPGKSKIAAGLACGFLHTVCKGIREGDIVLCPNGQGTYRVGEVTHAYSFHPGGVLPHRRTVRWLTQRIQREDMSDNLRHSTGSIGTVSKVTRHAKELDRLIGGHTPPMLAATDDSNDDPAVFTLEKHLEEFLVANWHSTALGSKYDIYEEEGELVGQQYPTDTGPIDILAISKDKKTLLVVELKKGRASDRVVGQIQRYMGYVLDELAEPDQQVQGVIIALQDDLRIRRALMVASGIEFYRYQVSFTLTK